MDNTHMKTNRLNALKKPITLGLIILLVFTAIITTQIPGVASNVTNIEWDVTLNFSETSGEISYVVFGEAPDANDGGPPDSYDAPLPPAPRPPYIKAWFNDDLPVPYDMLLKDYRQYPDTEKIWDLYVRWRRNGYDPINITISWDNNNFDGCEYEFVVLMWYNSSNDEWELAADMLTEGSYMYVPRYSNEWQIDHFQIVAVMDITPPETTCELEGELEGGVYISDVIVTLEAIDDRSGVDYTMYSVDGGDEWLYEEPFIVSEDGERIVWFYSVDYAGNVESTKSVDFKIDKTDPVTIHSLSGTMGNNDWYISNVVVTLTASDVTSEINYTMYNLDGTGWTEYMVSFIMVTTDGYHIVEYYSVDMAGNVESTKSVSFKIDQTAPETSCELVPPEPDGENDWYVSNVEVKLTATDDTSEVSYTMYNRDGTGWTEYTNPFTVTTDGYHIVEYYSVDMAGNIESMKSVDFKIDKTDPVTIHSLSGTMGNNGWYISNVVVTLTASDVTSEVSYTMYNRDGTGWTEYMNSFTVTTDGYHIVEYYSVDMAGNVESTKSVSFKIDQTYPTIKLTWIKDDSKLVADVDDETSDVAKVEFYVNGEYVGKDTTAPYEWKVTKPRIGDKGHAIVFDNAGLSATSPQINAISQSQSQSSSSTPVQRAFLSNLELTVEPESITDAKPNEITDSEPELDAGRVWLRGLLWRCNRIGDANHALAIRLYYIEFTPTERTDGMVTMNRVAFKDSAYTGRMYEVAGLFTYVFGFFEGGLEIL